MRENRAEEKGKQSDPIAREPAWFVDLRSQLEAEPLATTWQHPLLSAVAVVVCLLLANLLHLKEPYWAAINAVVVMQTELKLAVSAARDRLLGTAVRAAMGWHP